MTNLFPSKPFYIQKEVVASLSKGDLTVRDLYTFIEYPVNKPGIVKGYILGGPPEYNKLLDLLHHPNLYCTFSSSYKDAEYFNSQKVIMRRLYDLENPNIPSNNIHSIVCELEFIDITRTLKLLSNTQNTRTLTFILAGPSSFWPCTYIPERWTTGQVKVNVWHSELDRGNLFRGRTEVTPFFSHSQLQHEGREIAATDKAYALQFEMEHERDQQSDDELLSTIVRLADDIILVASFASRRRISWFSYKFEGEKTINYTRQLHERSSENLYRDDMLVDTWDAKRFLLTAVKELVYLRENEMDLSIPILTIIAAHETDILEPQFTLYFLALEKIKDMYARKNGLSEIIRVDNQWDKLRRNVEEIISDFLINANPEYLIDMEVSLSKEHLQDENYNNEKKQEAEQLIKEKLIELRRPSIRRIVECLCKEYGVVWEDLYPENSKATLFNTRNKLIHSAEKIDGKMLLDETYRIRSLAERLILKMLKWDNIRNAPRYSHLLRLRGEKP